MKIERLLTMKKLSLLVVYTLVILAVLLSIAPIVYLVITSFKEPQLTFAIPPVWNFTPTTQNYNEVLSSTDFGKYFMNSVIVALTTTGIALFLGTFAAYGFSRFRFRGSFWLRMSSLIPTNASTHCHRGPAVCLIQQAGLDRHAPVTGHIVPDIHHPAQHLDDDRFLR